MASDPRLAHLAPQPAASFQPPPPPPPPVPVETPLAAQVDGPADSTDQDAAHGSQSSPSFKLKFCTVCASNNNRSMEAHARLATASDPYPVISFGTGSLVRLPGPSISQPNVYNFNTTSYNQMYEELFEQDQRLYRHNGVLNMLDRNRHLKWGPERFQDWVAGLPRLDHKAKGDKGALGTEGGVVDVIITCEERCWDAVIDNLLDRGAPLNRPVHVFNIDIRDNNEEALVGGKAILELADKLNVAAEAERIDEGMNGWDNGHGHARANFDDRVPDVLAEWQEKWPGLPALWTLAWL